MFPVSGVDVLQNLRRQPRRPSRSISKSCGHRSSQIQRKTTEDGAKHPLLTATVTVLFHVVFHTNKSRCLTLLCAHKNQRSSATGCTKRCGRALDMAISFSCQFPFTQDPPQTTDRYSKISELRRVASRFDKIFWAPLISSTR